MHRVRHLYRNAMGEWRDSLLWPETGGIKTLLELALIYHLVAVATPVLIDQIELMNPAIVPEPFTTALFVLLWLGIGAGVAWLLYTESIVSAHRFDDPDVVERRLDYDEFDRRQLAKYVGMAAVGAALAVATYEAFVATFLSVIDLLVIVAEEFEWAITIVDGLYVAGFLGGFLLFATAVDRLVVDGLRRYVRRQLEIH